MSADECSIVAANAVGAAVLLFAAFAKFASPQLLARSLHKLTGRNALSSTTTVRVIGAMETVVAFGLLPSATRLIAATVLVLLGLSFVSLGIVGRARRIDEPCGCFGALSQQPLGNQNIVLGVVLALIGAQNLRFTDALSHDAAAAGPILAAGLLGLASIAMSRSTMSSRADELPEEISR